MFHPFHPGTLTTLGNKENKENKEKYIFSLFSGLILVLHPQDPYRMMELYDTRLSGVVWTL